MGRTENLIDPPITEKDAHSLHVFYEQFLRKDGHDALSFLKAVVLLRRGDLREFVHNFALLKKRLEVMIREQRQRALILSFPSTIQRVHDLVWEGQEAYGEDGSTVMTILGTQASDYLDQTEMFRIDLDSLLSDCPPMLPEDVEALKQSIASGFGAHLFLLTALADHVLLTLLPYDHPQPTEALLRARTFLEKGFGEKAEDQIIEFFVIGGGYLRIAAGRVVLCGVHPVFDPTFADPGQPETDRLMAEFRRCKFQLTLDALRSELPDQSYVIQG
jgi:hypothetical protein